MYPWHNYMSWITAFRQINLFVYIAVLVQRVITSPTIGKYCGARFNRITHERNQIVSRSIRCTLHSHSTESFWIMYFNSNYNYRFSPCSSTAFAISFRSPNKGFIYFDIAAKSFSSWTYHGTTHLMEPTPSSLVATETENALKPQCITTKLLARNIPHCLKPQSDRLPCSLKYCAGDNRYLVLARCTTNQPRSHMPAFSSLTHWTDKTFGPAKILKILNTGLFCEKPFVELL